MDDLVYEAMARSVSIGGFGLAVAMASYFIKRFLDDFKELHDNVIELNRVLAAVVVRLERIPEYETLLRDHGVRLAYLEGSHHDPARATH